MKYLCRVCGKNLDGLQEVWLIHMLEEHTKDTEHIVYAHMIYDTEKERG